MAKKKISENPKAVESRERKATSKKDGQAKEHAKAEDEFWEQAGEGAKSKASKKKEDQAKEREAAAAKKAEAKRLAAEEDAEMASLAKKTAKKAAEPKVQLILWHMHPCYCADDCVWCFHGLTCHAQVTSHQLQLQQEAERKAQQAAVEEAAKAKKKVVTEDSYAQMVDTQNVNRNANDVEARSVTEALSALGVKEEEDKHPERYVSSWKAVYTDLLALDLCVCVCSAIPA